MSDHANVGVAVILFLMHLFYMEKVVHLFYRTCQCA